MDQHGSPEEGAQHQGVLVLGVEVEEGEGHPSSPLHPCRAEVEEAGQQEGHTGPWTHRWVEEGAGPCQVGSPGHRKAQTLGAAAAACASAGDWERGRGLRPPQAQICTAASLSAARPAAADLEEGAGPSQALETPCPHPGTSSWSPAGPSCRAY